MKTRRANIRLLFKVNWRFNFRTETIHQAVLIMDKFLSKKINGQDPIDFLRHNFESCRGVISDQIVTFIAAVGLFLSAKYNEVKYPMIDDVCQLMECPFKFDEFTEMELYTLNTILDCNLEQIKTPLSILETITS